MDNFLGLFTMGITMVPFVTTRRSHFNKGSYFKNKTIEDGKPCFISCIVFGCSHSIWQYNSLLLSNWELFTSLLSRIIISNLLIFIYFLLNLLINILLPSFLHISETQLNQWLWLSISKPGLTFSVTVLTKIW